MLLPILVKGLGVGVSKLGLAEAKPKMAVFVSENPEGVGEKTIAEGSEELVVVVVGGESGGGYGCFTSSQQRLLQLFSFSKSLGFEQPSSGQFSFLGSFCCCDLLFFQVRLT